MIGPRHSTFEADPRAAALQGGENARDIAEALTRKIAGHWVSLPRYTATGNPRAPIALGASAFPIAVALVGAALIKSKSTSPEQTEPIQGSLGFSWDGPTKTLTTFEPSGLIAGESYELTYLVGERD